MKRYGKVQWTVEEIMQAWATIHGDVPFPEGPDYPFEEMADGLKEQIDQRTQEGYDKLVGGWV